MLSFFFCWNKTQVRFLVLDEVDRMMELGVGLFVTDSAAVMCSARMSVAGFGSQLEEIVTQGAMQRTQFLSDARQADFE